MNRNDIKPWRQALDLTLLPILWFTFSPLIAMINKDGLYVKKKTMKWLIIFSPFTWGLISFVFLLFGFQILNSYFPAVESFMHSFPELNLIANNTPAWRSLFLVSYFLPLYAFCVVVLFIAMFFTGWSYREASVYICEYFEPWFCVAVAIALIIWIAASMRKMNSRGKWLSIFPLGLECWCAWHNAEVYFNRIASYKGMGINEIFDYVVSYLIKLGASTGTDYVTANMIVYILPIAIILILGYLAWVNFTVNKATI